MSVNGNAAAIEAVGQRIDELQAQRPRLEQLAAASTDAAAKAKALADERREIAANAMVDGKKPDTADVDKRLAGARAAREKAEDDAAAAAASIVVLDERIDAAYDEADRLADEQIKTIHADLAARRNAAVDKAEAIAATIVPLLAEAAACDRARLNLGWNPPFESIVGERVRDRLSALGPFCGVDMSNADLIDELTAAGQAAMPVRLTRPKPNVPVSPPDPVIRYKPDGSIERNTIPSGPWIYTEPRDPSIHRSW